MTSTWNSCRSLVGTMTEPTARRKTKYLRGNDKLYHRKMEPQHTNRCSISVTASRTIYGPEKSFVLKCCIFAESSGMFRYAGLEGHFLFMPYFTLVAFQRTLRQADSRETWVTDQTVVPHSLSTKSPFSLDGRWLLWSCQTGVGGS